MKYLCFMVIISLWGCQENQEHDASREVTATPEVSSEQKKD